MTSGAPPTELLTFAIHQLYDVFSAYTMPTEVEMSPYRGPEKAIGPMKRMPLRELTASDLDYYAGTALSTVGDEALFKYALPRLLELVTEGEFLTDSEIVLSKLSYGKWHDWPEPEQEAVRRFLMAWWQNTINSAAWTLQTNADTVLISIAQTESDLSWYLSAWEASSAPSATDQLAEFLMFHEEERVLAVPPFLQGDALRWQQILHWLTRPATLTRLRKGQIHASERGYDDEYDAYASSVDLLQTLLSEESA